MAIGYLSVSYPSIEFLDGLLLSLAYEALIVTAQDIARAVPILG